MDRPTTAPSARTQSASSISGGLFTRTSASASITGGAYGNVSVDECWSSWELYWATEYFEPTTTYTSFSTWTVESEAAETQYATYTEHTTSTMYGGGYALGTTIMDTTGTDTEVITFPQAGTSTISIIITAGVSVQPSKVPKPSCKLPKTVSHCDDQWEAWATSQLAPSPTPPPNCDLNVGYYYGNNHTTPACAVSYFSASNAYWDLEGSGDMTPACTQAFIGGSLCQSIRDNYVLDENANFINSLYPAGAHYTYVSRGTVGADFGGGTTTFFWPTSSTIGAPGKLVLSTYVPWLRLIIEQVVRWGADDVP